MYTFDSRAGMKTVSYKTRGDMTIGSLAVGDAPKEEIEKIVAIAAATVDRMGFRDVKVTPANDDTKKNAFTTHVITAKFHPVRGVLTAMMNLTSGEHAIVFDYYYGEVSIYLNPYSLYEINDLRKYRWIVHRRNTTWADFVYALRRMDKSIPEVGANKGRVIYRVPIVDDLRAKKTIDDIATEKRNVIAKVKGLIREINDFESRIESRRKNIAKIKEEYETEFGEAYPEERGRDE